MFFLNYHLHFPCTAVENSCFSETSLWKVSCQRNRFPAAHRGPAPNAETQGLQLAGAEVMGDPPLSSHPARLWGAPPPSPHQFHTNLALRLLSAAPLGLCPHTSSSLLLCPKSVFSYRPAHAALTLVGGLRLFPSTPGGCAHTPLLPERASGNRVSPRPEQ